VAEAFPSAGRLAWRGTPGAARPHGTMRRLSASRPWKDATQGESYFLGRGGDALRRHLGGARMDHPREERGVMVEKAHAQSGTMGSGDGFPLQNTYPVAGYGQGGQRARGAAP